MKTIQEIKQECRQIIAKAEKATSGPWETLSRDDIGTEYGAPVRVKAGDYDVARNGTPGCFIKSEDASFIAASRSFTPAAAKALLDLIAYVEEDLAYPPLNLRAREKLETLRRDWDN